MLKKIIAILVLFTLLTPSILIAQNEPLDLKNYITENSSNIWKKYLTNFKSGVEGNVKIQVFRSEKLEHEYNCYIIRQKNWSLAEISNLQKNSEIVNSFSQNYFFKIHRSNQDQWSIDFVEKNSPDGELNNLENYVFPTGKEKIMREFRDYVCRFYLLKCLALQANTFLPTLMELPEFNIEQIEKIQKDGINYYSIKFSFTPKDGNDVIKQKKSSIQNNNNNVVSELPEGLIKYPQIFVRNGSLLLTMDYLLIKEAEVEILNQGKHKIICNYKYENDIPFISEYILKYNEGNYEEKYSFDLNLTTNQNPKRFTLSHYGFPEPDFDNSRRINRVRYILMGLGAILIGIALWRMIQKRRGRM
jgi:hypothetical protein